MTGILNIIEAIYRKASIGRVGKLGFAAWISHGLGDRPMLKGEDSGILENQFSVETFG